MAIVQVADSRAEQRREYGEERFDEVSKRNRCREFNEPPLK
jgi:hypothetical protein